MARSKATTVESYLEELPSQQREAISAVRDIVVEHMPAGYEEAIEFGMISYQIPLERYPDTYNGKALGYVALGAGKNKSSLHLMGVYMEQDAARLKDAFRKAGKKLDMGRSCVRFKKPEDLPLDAIGEIIASMPPERFIELYEASRGKT